MVGVLTVVLLGAAVLVALVAGGTSGHPLLSLGIPLVIVVYLLGRAVSVRVPEPEGLPLTPAASPRLFALVEDVRARLGGRRVHRIVLTDDFNAGIAQVPRFGLLGGARNHLVLGLPLLFALSTEQMRSVLAHEFGHLGGAHGRSGTRAYRLRATWIRLLEALEARRGLSSLVFARFFGWYAPYFAAYSFVLARTLEDEADRIMAEVVGGRAAADTLAAITLADDHLEHRFWPAFLRRSREEPEPPPPYTTMEAALAARDGARAEHRLQRLLNRPTDPDDTHPSLAERLDHLGEPPRVPGPPEASAARDLLGGALPVLVSALDQMWQAQEREVWEERYREATRTRRQLTGLEEQASLRALSPEEAWDRASFTEDLVSPEAARPLYAEVLARDPAQADAHYALGRILLEAEDAAGVAHLEQAASLDARLGPDAYDRVLDFLAESGGDVDLDAYRDRREEAVTRLLDLLAERRDVDETDAFLPHGLPAEALDRLRAQLAGEPLVLGACLVRKATEHFPDMPLYVLGLTLAESWYRLGAGRRRRETMGRLLETVDLPAGAFFVLLDAPGVKALGAAMSAVPGAAVYVRGCRLSGAPDAPERGGGAPETDCGATDAGDPPRSGISPPNRS